MEPGVFFLLPGFVGSLISGKGSPSSLFVETHSVRSDVFFLLPGLVGCLISGKTLRVHCLWKRVLWGLMFFFFFLVWLVFIYY